MKKILFIILAVVIIVGCFFIVKNKRENKYDYEIPKITQYNYYICIEGEKFGVIEKNGKKVIDSRYSQIIIPNPDKDIFICYDNEKSIVLNSKNEELFKEYDMVIPIKLKSVASTLSYEKNVLIYKENGKYGLIDLSGKEITQNIYDSIENLEPTEGKFLVKVGAKYGVIDLKGNILVKAEYDHVTSDNYYTENDGYKKSGFVISKKSNDGYKSGYISYTGNQLLDTNYNDVKRVDKEDNKNIFLIASENGKYGLYKNKKNIIKNEYQSILYDDNTELLIVQKNKKYGIMALNGKIIIDINNNEIEPRGIYIYTKKENENKVYDKNGQIVDINFNRSIYKTENEEYKISTILNNNITYYGITDKEGKNLVEEKYRYIEYLFNNYFIAKDEEGKLGIINNNGKEILETKYSSLQKIKGKNIIQAMNSDSGEVEIYSSKIEKKGTLKSFNVQIQDDYVIAYDNENKIYLDNEGNIIEDISKLKSEIYPDKIGEYKKEQITIENIYYIKE